LCGVESDHRRLPLVQCAVDALVHPGGQAVGDGVGLDC
jgi:hypothetical protein